MRPTSLKKFIGKESIIKSLQIGIEVFKTTKKPLDHILFHGPPGVGKTSLAQIIATEMNVRIKIIQAINIQNVADLIGVLSSLKDNDLIFIDEIHSIRPDLAELLYPALEDNVLDLIVGKKHNSKTIRLPLPKFTLIGATTNFGALSKAFEERFGYIFFIDLYTKDEIIQIIKQKAKILNISLSQQTIEVIAENSRGTPRNCKRLLKRIHDYLAINQPININKILRECGFLYKGISEIDMKYMLFLSKQESKIASLKTLTQGINIDEQTILEKIEPFLINFQYIVKTPQGRQLTKAGQQIVKEHYKLNENN